MGIQLSQGKASSNSFEHETLAHIVKRMDIVKIVVGSCIQGCDAPQSLKGQSRRRTLQEELQKRRTLQKDRRRRMLQRSRGTTAKLHWQEMGHPPGTGQILCPICKSSQCQFSLM
jgi:hypothetical protein